MNTKTRPVNTVKLYRTAPHECSYLPDQEATTLFVDPDLPLTNTINTQLNALGFRRSGMHIYKPDCLTCNACISCRILVNDFQFKRRYNKLLNRNSDIRVTESLFLHEEECYELYCDYINKRHGDGDMFPPNREQYAAFITMKTDDTVYYKFYAGEKLKAVAVVDKLRHGLSAVYTFFDVHEPRRSLGNFVILWQIKKAQQLDLPYLYLGYWVRECDKMRYKSQYRPLELLMNGRWKRVN